MVEPNGNDLKERWDVQKRDTYGITCLHRAVMHDLAMEGNPVKVQWLLESGADPNVQENELRRTALHFAAIYGLTQTLLTLVIGGADNSLQDTYGRTAAHYASENNHVLTLLALIQSHAAIDSADNLGMTPLHLAAQKKAHGSLGELISAGVNVNYQDNFGRTALHIASDQNDKTAAKLLTDAQAKLDIREDLGMTPSDYARYSTNVPQDPFGRDPKLLCYITRSTFKPTGFLFC
jgi:ankyrin repeat protein